MTYRAYLKWSVRTATPGRRRRRDKEIAGWRKAVAIAPAGLTAAIAPKVVAIAPAGRD